MPSNRTVHRLMINCAGLFVLGAGCFLSLQGASEILQGKASRSWPTTNGKVVSSQVVTQVVSRAGFSHRSYRPSIHYEYDVDGRRFASERIRFGEMGDSNYVNTQSMVNRLARGTTVTVAYQPGRPETSVLEPGAFPISTRVAIAGTPFLLFGFIVLYWQRPLTEHFVRQDNKRQRWIANSMRESPQTG